MQINTHGLPNCSHTDMDLRIHNQNSQGMKKKQAYNKPIITRTKIHTNNKEIWNRTHGIVNIRLTSPSISGGNGSLRSSHPLLLPHPRKSIYIYLSGGSLNNRATFLKKVPPLELAFHLYRRSQSFQILLFQCMWDKQYCLKQWIYNSATNFTFSIFNLIHLSFHF